jgi:hypothetical protein
MTAFCTLHVVIAAMCLPMGLVHLWMFFNARSARANLWICVCFLGFVALNLGIGGSSAAGHALGFSRRVWLLVGMSSAPVLWPALLLACWASVEQPLTPVRRGAVAAALVFGLLRVADVAWAVHLLDPNGLDATWEVQSSPSRFSAPVGWVVSLAVCGAWVFEALRARRHRGRLGLLPLFGAIPAGALTAREVALSLGWASGPPLFGVTAFAFGLFASISVGGQYIAFVRKSRAGLEKYQFLKRLGQGGMGELHLARRAGPNGFSRLVALKKMLVSAEGPALDRFLAEARVSAELLHPNIVAVLDLGELSGGWFIEMEYLSGVNLGDVLAAAYHRSVPVPDAFTAWCGVQICRGLAHAHAAGVIHRDIKPSNVMVTFEGELKLIDFGIAKTEATADAPSAEVSPAGPETRAGLIAGSEGFIAPERLQGAPATPISDLYSVAVVLRLLVEAAAARENAPRQSVTETMPSRPRPADGIPDPPKGANPALWAVIRQCLAPDPAQRHGSAQEMGDALRAVAAKLPAVDVETWLRESFAGRWTQEREILATSGFARPTTPALATATGPRLKAPANLSATTPARHRD